MFEITLERKFCLNVTLPNFEILHGGYIDASYGLTRFHENWHKS